MDPTNLPEVWLPLAAAFIPLVTAVMANLADEPSTRSRVAISAALAGLLAVTETIATGDPFTIEGLAAGFGVAFIAQLAFYLSAGKAININRLGGSGGHSVDETSASD